MSASYPCARCGATDTFLMRAVWPPNAPALCQDGYACQGRAARASAAAPVELDWRTSPEHRGLQATAFPETITRGEQGALL